MNDKKSEHFKLIDDLFSNNQCDYEALAHAMDQIRDVQFESVLKRVMVANQRPIVKYGIQFADLVQNSRTNRAISLDFPNEFILFLDHAFLSCTLFAA